MDTMDESIWHEMYAMYFVKSDLSFAETVFRLVLRDETVRVLKDVFDINLSRDGVAHIVVDTDLNSADGPESTIPVLDGLTYDLVTSPVAIPISAYNEEV